MCYELKSCPRISSIATALGLIIAALSRQWVFLLLEGLGSGWEALGSSYTEAALSFHRCTHEDGVASRAELHLRV